MSEDSLTPTERELWGYIKYLQLQLEEVKLEQVFQRADRTWPRQPQDYFERAVADEYGIDHRLFYQALPRGRKRKKDEDIVEARHLLYCLLHSVVGLTVNNIRDNYRNHAHNTIDKWMPIFNMVNGVRPTATELAQEYDRCYPRLMNVYNRAKQGLIEDGLWQEVFTVDTFEQQE